MNHRHYVALFDLFTKCDSVFANIRVHESGFIECTLSEKITYPSSSNVAHGVEIALLFKIKPHLAMIFRKTPLKTNYSTWYLIRYNVKNKQALLDAIRVEALRAELVG